MILDRPLRMLRFRLRRRWFRRRERHLKHSTLPSPLRRDTIYLVGEPEQWLVFLCPCRLAHDIVLAIGDGGPWNLRTSRRRRPTIRPSVNASGPGRRCHFWITHGQVRWCADSCGASVEIG